MGLKFPPHRGAIVMCDYDTGFQAPEMIKTRLVVIVSPRLPSRDNLCAVVPLSTTAARSGIAYQCKVLLPSSPPRPFEGVEKWAKADMLATLSLSRLSFPRIGKDRATGQRIYYRETLAREQMAKVELAMLEALGLGHLTAQR